MQITRRTDPDVDEAVLSYIQAKADADLANSKLETAEANLLKLMEERQVKTVKHHDGPFTFSATYTQRVANQINEQGLRKALTAKVFDRYTVKKLDRKALEQAMSDGDVDPMVVAKFVEQVPGKTYLTYRVKEVSDEPEGL